MTEVKSRREMYSAATRTALLDEATLLFAERGYAGTSLEDVASASQVTRGAVYHHFASKQALFEAVLELQEARATEAIAAAVAAPDPWDSAILALDAYLRQCCDPVYGRLVWLEGPAALDTYRADGHVIGLHGDQHRPFRSAEQAAREVTRCAEKVSGYLDGTGFDTLVQFTFWMLGGAGLAVAEAPPQDKPRVRDEWGRLIGQAIGSLRIR